MTDITKCERGEELVGFLYGEATAAERRNFEQHLSACVACRDELASFRELRGAVREWRAEVVEREPALPLAAILPEFARNGRSTQTATATTPSPHRAAWAALREFFSLTPTWARAGLVAASLLVCALAALAVINAQFSWNDKGIAFRTGVTRQMAAPQPANAPATQTPTLAAARYTQADVDRLTVERDAARAESIAAHQQLADSQQQVATLNASLTKRRAQYQTLLASTRTNQGAPRLNRRTGAQDFLAEDEGLRLSELLTEVSSGGSQPQVKHNER
jgi:anti-sigma factor RsiW